MKWGESTPSKSATSLNTHPLLDHIVRLGTRHILLTPEIQPVFVKIMAIVLKVLSTPLRPPTPATATRTVPTATLQSTLGSKICVVGGFDDEISGKVGHYL